MGWLAGWGGLAHVVQAPWELMQALDHGMVAAPLVAGDIAAGQMAKQAWSLCNGPPALVVRRHCLPAGEGDPSFLS